MADITKNDIMHIANLAMLNLTDEEIEQYTKDTKDILGYAEMINSIDTSNINETIGTGDKKNAFRKDEVHQCLNRDDLLKNAPCHDEGMFNVPKVIN